MVEYPSFICTAASSKNVPSVALFRKLCSVNGTVLVTRPPLDLAYPPPRPEVPDLKLTRGPPGPGQYLFAHEVECISADVRSEYVPLRVSGPQVPDLDSVVPSPGDNDVIVLLRVLDGISSGSYVIR